MVRHFRRKARARAALAVKTKQEHPQAKRDVLSSPAANGKDCFVMAGLRPGHPGHIEKYAFFAPRAARVHLDADKLL
jgi:hypothetical protein